MESVKGWACWIGMVIVEEEEAVLDVNVGCPIVIHGDFVA